jgi:sec-independent protein translocase protein TatA
MDFGPAQIAIVLIIGLLVFGPKRLPELGRSLGGGLKEFKQSITGEDDDGQRVPPALQAPNDEAGISGDPARAEVRSGTR